MKVRKSIPTSVLAAIAALSVAAPVAGAVPLYDGHPPHHALQGDSYDVNRDTGAYTPADASADMHASTVKPGFDTQSVPADLRTEGAKAPIQSRVVTGDLPGGGDLRSEVAKEPRPVPGLPVFPDPDNVPAPKAPEPVAATDGDGGSFDWPLAGLIAGGAIALLGAALIGGRQMRGHTRPAH
jgi:hypothetical protein